MRKKVGEKNFNFYRCFLERGVAKDGELGFGGVAPLKSALLKALE